MSGTGLVRSNISDRLISQADNGTGYMKVTLYKPFHKKYYVHRLVATMFLENPENYEEVNHVDGNKKNNSASNLEWCTKLHNEREARRTGLKEYKPFYIVRDGKVYEYEFPVDLANEIGVTKRTIMNWLQKRNHGYYKHNISQIEYKCLKTRESNGNIERVS